MTREEAIKLLVNATYSDEWQGNEDLTTAHHMAIKALEQEPCEDLISCEAVIEWLKAKDIIKLSSQEKVARKELKALPSGKPQPKTGHWIMSDDGLYRPICNNCGAHPWKGYIPTVEEATEVFKYCPDCGCAMVEPQERSGKE